MRSYYVANGLGNHIDDPTVVEMRTFLDAVDVTDEEHGAAWLGTENGSTLEWSKAVLVFTGPGVDAPPRHMPDVPRGRALDLWAALAKGDLAVLERCEWRPGNGHVPGPALEARWKAWQLEDDRKFYDLLGAERAEEPCRTEGCTRGAIALSVLCRVHHFESVRKRPSPFTD